MTISNKGALGKRTAAVFAAVLLILTALMGTVTPERSEAAANDEFTVYLQAGHSPSVYGSGNIENGVREAVLNEQVTIKTYHALRSAGINVKLLNPLSLDTTLPSVIKGPPGENKQYAYYSPEPAMLTALTSPGLFDSTETKQADLVIALHHNAYSDTSIRGYEIYYANTSGGNYGRSSEDVESSRRIATCLGNRFANDGFYVPARVPSVRVNNSNNGITKNAPMGAVLIEVGYMTNPSDMAAICNTSNQDILAKRVADAVADYKAAYWTPTHDLQFTQTGTSVLFNESTETIRMETTVQPADKVANIRASVWPISLGETVAKWYTLADRGNGRYTANISIRDFEYTPGEYVVNLFLTDVNSTQRKIAEGRPTAVGGDRDAPTATSVTATVLSPTSNAAVLHAENVTDESGVKTVRFCVWSEEGGQDDVYWYDGYDNGDGSWSANMVTTNHADRIGSYMVEAYAVDNRSNEGVIGATTVVFAHKDGIQPELYGELLYKKLGNRLIVTATDVRDPAGVRGVRIGFGNAGTSVNDLTWYKAAQHGSDWIAVIDLNNHKNSDGRYMIDAYATDEKGNDGQIATLSFLLEGDTTPPTAETLSVIEGRNGVATMSLQGVTDDKSSVTSVEFSVTTDSQESAKQYKAVKQADGSWTSQLDASANSRAKGPYEIEAYATDGSNNRGLIGSTSFTFGQNDSEMPTAKGVTLDRSKFAGKVATVTIDGVSDDTGIEKVWLVVTPQSDAAKSVSDAETQEAMMARYDASIQAEKPDTWVAMIGWGSEFSIPGTYTFSAYAEDWSGKKACVGTTKVEVEAPSANTNYYIMGKNTVTVAQLVNAQLRAGWNNNWYNGMTVDEFCSLYYNLCDQEGVNVQVAYAQMLHETDSLRYGNLVVREQFNFAGLGSTGEYVAPQNRKATHRYTATGEDAGIIFTSVENGIKSQIQHLKGYATTDPLNLPKADEYDRYGRMVLGCAPTVMHLSQKWATSASYGRDICNYIAMIGTMSTEMPSYLSSNARIADVPLEDVPAIDLAPPYTPEVTQAAIPRQAVTEETPQATAETVQGSAPPAVVADGASTENTPIEAVESAPPVVLEEQIAVEPTVSPDSSESAEQEQ